VLLTLLGLQERGYAVKDNNQQFEPTSLGEALIGAYENMGLKTIYEYAAASPNNMHVMEAHIICSTSYVATWSHKVPRNTQVVLLSAC
jgi:DNA topoisomerase IA